MKLLRWITDSIGKTYFALALGFLGISIVSAAVVTTSPTNFQAGDASVLNASIGAAVTTIKVSPFYKYENGLKVKTCLDSASGFATITDISRTEWISFGTVSCNTTTYVSTLTDVRRGLSPKSASFTAGTGMAWDAGANFKVIDYPLVYNYSVYKDIVNTTMGSGQYATGNTHQAGINLGGVTTAQRDLFTYVRNGDFIYNTTTGTFQERIGNAWVDVGNNGITNATETAAGKVQLGTVADQTGSTVTGTSGAATVVQTKNLVGSGGLANRGKIPYLDKNGIMSGSLLGNGLPSSMTVLTGSEQWTSIESFPSIVDNVVFGNAVDGDYTLPNDITLSRDMFYGTLNLNGHVLNTAGYRVFAYTITGSGKIKAATGGNGGNGGNSSSVAGGAKGSSGTSVLGVTVPNSLQGEQGGVGANGGNTLCYTGGNSAGSNVTNSLGTTIGSVGGMGGLHYYGGTSTVGTVTIHQLTDVLNYLRFGINNLGTFTAFTGDGQSAGGGGGGGNCSGGSNTYGGGGGGGGAGAEGGRWFISTKVASGTWTVESIGGNGGNGGNAGINLGNYGGAGGGGAGGPGGSGIFIYHDKSTWTGSFTLTGGTKGTKGLNGDSYATDGNNGHSGVAFQISI